MWRGSIEVLPGHASGAEIEESEICVLSLDG